MTISIRPVEAEDYEAWKPLYRGYRDFYRMPHSDDAIEAIWAWLMDPTHVVDGLVAECDGELIGLAHYREMPSPLRGTTVGFLDDLFIAPEARGAKLGELFFERLKEIAADRGWPAMRWLTADDNYRARTLYDRVGRKTSWNLYEFTL